MKSAEDFLKQLNQDQGVDLAVSGMEPLFSEDNADVQSLKQKIESRAVSILAIREHGAKELTTKLLTKFPETAELLAEYSESEGFIRRLVKEVVAHCQQENWQSDERYIEQMVRSLSDKGQGPLKIQQKLQQGSSRSDLIQAYLDWDESEWVEIARNVLEKKYGDCVKPSARNEQAKRMRFLQSRGFTQNVIWKAFA